MLKRSLVTAAKKQNKPTINSFFNIDFQTHLNFLCMAYVLDVSLISLPVVLTEVDTVVITVHLCNFLIFNLDGLV